MHEREATAVTHLPSPMPSCVRELRCSVAAIQWHDRVLGDSPPDLVEWAERNERLLRAIDARRRYRQVRRVWGVRG